MKKLPLRPLEIQNPERIYKTKNYCTQFSWENCLVQNLLFKIGCYDVLVYVCEFVNPELPIAQHHLLDM